MTRFWTWTVAGLAGLAVLVGVGSAPAYAMTGGREVTDDREAPWMATLAVKGDGPLLERASCGGALVAPDKVLTAAHCVVVPDFEKLAEYHVGARVLSGDPGEVAGVLSMDVHPEYRLLPSPENPDDPAASSAAYDVAVVTLDREIAGVPVLPLASKAPKEGAATVFYGHGLTVGDDGGLERGDVLRRGVYQVRDEDSCAEETPAAVDDASVLCAQGWTAEACFGDSGGPLVG